MTLTSSVPVRFASSAPGERAASPGAAGACPDNAAAKSSRVIRPAGPLPATFARSMPASRARRRVAGEAMTRPPPEAGGAAFGAVPWPLLRGAVAATVAAAVTAGAPAGGAAGAAGDSAAAAESVSNTISSEPTLTISPGAPLTVSTRPVTGAGTSTAALSVITSAMSWSSLTRSPTLTCQATISASTVPSPRSGILKTYRLIATPSPS